MKVRDALWKHGTILDTFIEKNPSQLSPDDLMLAETWNYHHQGQFIIFKVLKNHAIFISQEKREDVFAVKGLYSSFEEMLGPYIPALVETVLLYQVRYSRSRLIANCVVGRFAPVTFQSRFNEHSVDRIFCNNDRYN
jgi:hypothetical protein